MKYLKIYEDFFPYKHNMTDEEFQKVWNYFCHHVFAKERIELMNQVILDTIEYTEFLEFSDNLKGRGLRLNPYFGLKYSKTSGTYMGLSHEFQREVNNRTYNIETCKGWDHVFKDAFNIIHPHARFGEVTHGIPYYQYNFNLSVIDPWEGKSVEELQKMLDGQSWNDITRYISQIAKGFALHHNLDLSISVKTYGNRGVFEKNSYKFEIRLEDFDFEPKTDSEIWN
jgi:hypothetical protein